MGSASALRPGTILGGRYRIERLLGEGGMGAVYEATQLDLGRLVALKTLFGNPDRERLARFHREAIAAATLGHPNIVQVTDFQSNPNEPAFLVMEHLRGTTLGALPRPLDIRRVALFTTQLLAALEVAHRTGIVHRDVKPDNVFIVDVPGLEGVVKVLDFGIAKLADPMPMMQTGAGVVMGSVGFMAPEQARGEYVDARADIYSVGACMYFSLSNQVPGGTLSSAGTLAGPPSVGHILSLATFRPDLPPSLVAIVDRAVARDPALRFTSAEEMRAALAPFAVASMPPPAPLASAPPPSAWTPPTMPQPATQPKPQRAMWPFVLGGVGLLLFSIAGAGAIVFVGGALASEGEEAPAPKPVVNPPARTIPAPLPPMASNAPTSTPKATPKPGPTPTPSPTPSPAPTPTVAPPSGATAVVVMGEASTYAYDYNSEMAPPVRARASQINACYKQNPLTEPLEFVGVWVDAEGKLLGLTPGQSGKRVAARDQCLDGALRGIAFGKPRKKPQGSQFSIVLRFEPVKPKAP